MVENDDRLHGIWVGSIHDSCGWLLSFDLGDILDALGPSVEPYSWIVNLYDWDGDANAVPFSGLKGVGLTTAEFRNLCRGIRQTFHGEIVAVAGHNVTDVYEDGRPDLRQFPKTKARVQILALDGAYFVVWTKSHDDVRALKKRLRDVVDEDMAKWCTI